MAELVGRDAERAKASTLVTKSRLVTLTGPGGCGKTRLAVEVASGPRPGDQGPVWWVELAGSTTAASVAANVAGAMGVRERAGMELAEALAGEMRERRGLLVLDNCEHLLSACSSLVTKLLRACPHLVVLTTSREPLAVEGETTMVVAPLQVPGPRARSASEVAPAEAARLFELRVRQVDPDFVIHDRNARAVAEICRRLDGIPLAIELAAARVRVLSPAQISDGLSDRFRLLTAGSRSAPVRQQTLEASVEWSFDLLDDCQRRALARLSVFATSFDLDAAVRIAAGDDLAAGEVLGMVAGLVDRSLLQVHERHGRARYRMLETIRLYARDRLAELDDPARVRDRHLDLHVDLAQGARAGLTGPDPEMWTARLVSELDDVRAAMAWAAETRRPSLVLRILEPTTRFWFDRGLSTEMGRWVSAALDDPDADEAEQLQALITASLLTMATCDYRACRSLAVRAVPRARASSDDDALALGLVLGAYSGLMTRSASTEAIRSDLDEAATLAERLENRPTAAYVLVLAGSAAAYGLSLPIGRRLLEQALDVCEQAQVTFHLGAVHVVLGMWAPFEGEIDACRWHSQTGLDLSRRLGRVGWTAVGLAMLGLADLIQGEVDPARERLAEANELIAPLSASPTLFDFAVHRWRAVAAQWSGHLGEARELAEAVRTVPAAGTSCWDEACAEWTLGAVALAEARHGDARMHLLRCQELSTAPDYPFTLGRSLEGLAQLAHVAGDLEEAWELAHGSLHVLADHGDRLGAAGALTTVAGVAASVGRADLALRLLAATDQFRAERGIAPVPLEVEDRTHVSVAEAQVTADAAATYRQEGAAMSLEDAIAYARRGRGARNRPEVGWGSLTPTERDLVGLVAEGHTNAQIGKRLFISANTVKKHLSSVYAKLDVGGRAELAVEVARRSD